MIANWLHSGLKGTEFPFTTQLRNYIKAIYGERFQPERRRRAPPRHEPLQLYDVIARVLHGTLECLAIDRML